VRRKFSVSGLLRTRRGSQMMFEEMLETAEHSAGDLLDEVAAGNI
jgi:hypothetical protein